MDTITNGHLSTLRQALLTLPATGPDGFEGFLAVVLTFLCGQPFRLATSGSQRGRDGDSAFDDGATYFEGKRYENSIPKKEVAVKLMDLRSDNQGQVDTWVLGATSETPALQAKDFDTNAAEIGIGLILLDWSDSDIPALALATAAADQSSKDFLRTNLATSGNAPLADAAALAIDHLHGLSQYPALSENLISKLKDPSTGLGLAKAENRRWLMEIFSNRIKARQHFGQPLAPGDPGGLSGRPRPNLNGLLKSAFEGQAADKVYAVMGYEGVGKSWLVAQTWLTSNPFSLLLVISASDLRDPDDIVELEALLVRLAIQQTGGQLTEAATRRWKRRFKAWRANPFPANIRIALLVDGLNQAPKFPWARWIDSAALFLNNLGGQLVITTRAPHFAQIRSAIFTTAERVVVPEWSETELTQILQDFSIDPNLLSGDVIATLRNPRILGLAIELLQKKQFQSMTELTVGRLLFEHMRHAQASGSTQLSANEFVKLLQELASDFLARQKAHSDSRGETDEVPQLVDDANIFDARLFERLGAVSTSRFFKEVGEDPDRYEIKNEGLQLALGLWLEEALKHEIRNRRDPNARLADILEPITALDKTAEVVASAIEIACLSETYDVNLAAALIRYYVNLQNPPADQQKAVGSLIKRAPDAFIKAAADAAGAKDHVANTGWLMDLIARARDDAGVWKAITDRVPEWLSTYSLAPERLMFSEASRDPIEKVQAEKEERRQKIAGKISDLTPLEEKFLRERMRPDELSDLSSLHRFAFFMLAGMPLKQFAPSLLAWSFSDSLNSAIRAPHKEFEALIRFNRVDWAATRDALLRTLQTALGESRSKVGDWTVVGIYRAIGDRSLGNDAEALAEVLTKDRERMPGWSHVENYSSVDPCDPHTARPANIDNTVEKFRALDAATIRLGMSSTADDHFFENSMSAIARFEPGVGVRKIKQWAENALVRDGFPRRQAIIHLLPHSVTLQKATVDALLAAGQHETDESDTDDGGARDAWLTSQYSVFVALPHFNGDQQLEAIAAMPGSRILLNMLATLQPANASKAESILQQAIDMGDKDFQIRVLAAIHYADTPLTDNSLQLIASLIGSSRNDTVRSESLAIAADRESEVLLTALVKSDWHAKTLDPEKNHFEIWYGSGAMISAIKKDLVSLDEGLGRLSLTHYGFAAAKLGTEAAAQIAVLIDSALEMVLGLADEPALPDIEVPAVENPSKRPPMVSLDEKAEPQDPWDALKGLGKLEDDYTARQERAHKAYQRFSRDLTIADARVALTDLGFAGVAALVESKPDLADKWFDLMMNATGIQSRSFHQFAIQLASAFASRKPSKGVELFAKFSATEPLVRHVMGEAKIPIEATAVWTNAFVPEIKAACFQRLQAAVTDREISIEVLAALWADQSDLLMEFVEALLIRDEPADICRALMVLGYGNPSARADTILQTYSNSSGFIGGAYEAAITAYEKDKWSHHWYNQLVTTTDPVEFWQAAILLTKIVDGRFSVWADTFVSISELCSRFLPTIEPRIENRIQKTQSKRKDKLFGQKLPDSAFLPG